MKYLCTSELVGATFVYKLPIGEDLLEYVNKYIAEGYRDVEPLTLEELETILFDGEKIRGDATRVIKLPGCEEKEYEINVSEDIQMMACELVWKPDYCINPDDFDMESLDTDVWTEDDEEEDNNETV